MTWARVPVEFLEEIRANLILAIVCPVFHVSNKKALCYSSIIKTLRISFDVTNKQVVHYSLSTYTSGNELEICKIRSLKSSYLHFISSLQCVWWITKSWRDGIFKIKMAWPFRSSLRRLSPRYNIVSDEHYRN